MLNGTVWDFLRGGTRERSPRSLGETMRRTQMRARVLNVASGKGGTGKSVVAANLAVLRAKAGERVLLVDFDAGMANAHLLLGIQPRYDLGHVLDGEVTAALATTSAPGGLSLIAGGVGRAALMNPTPRELEKLFTALAPLEEQFDLIVIDHGAGLSYATLAHLAAAKALLLVTSHEVTALSDGYALYKQAVAVNKSIQVGVVVNRAPDEKTALAAWERFQSASRKFLGRSPALVGCVPADDAVARSVQARTPLVIRSPQSASAAAIERISRWPVIEDSRGIGPFYEAARKALR
jgi:flagellar biosynthesis protein FlhG